MHTASSPNHRTRPTPSAGGGVIFSDLDGTFLDDGYRPALDRDAFARVAQRWRVIWVSSRTAGELAQVQAQLGHREDAIGENGGICLCWTEARARALGMTEQRGDAWVARLAQPVEEVRGHVRSAFARFDAPLRTVDEMSSRELAERSGYSVADAERARARQTSVLIADADTSDPRVAQALDALRAAGCSVTHGGRWTSVIRGSDKGAAVRAWLAAVHGDGHAPVGTVAAIGNADNDEPLLRAVPRAFAVRAADGSYAERLASVPNVTRLARAGTAGWTEMLELLDAPPEWTQ